MKKESEITEDSVSQMLEDQAPSRVKRWFWVVLLLLLLLLAVFVFVSMEGPEPSKHYQQVTIQRGDLKLTVTATGNLTPVNQVDIGTELSGTIADVLVDINQKVERGQVLARLNTDQLQNTLALKTAALASAKANVVLKQASVREAQVNYQRVKKLYQSQGGSLLSESELDTALASLQRAEAEVEVARAGVMSAQAELQAAQTTLDKATITSPIDGVVLSREVEPGQTVAASLSAPTLFTLAEDLSMMELEVSVDEADVGQVAQGQPAKFTVDAWPNRNYSAVISRVSLGSVVSDNVVSYTTLLTVDNDDLSLRPGMTATASIQIQQREKVLLVSNAAFRFTPQTDDQTMPVMQSAPSGGGILSKLLPRPPAMQNKRSQSQGLATTQPGEQTLWVLEQGQPRPLTVKTGLSDGQVTEVMSDAVHEGMSVITSQLVS